MFSCVCVCVCVCVREGRRNKYKNHPYSSWLVMNSKHIHAHCIHLCLTWGHCPNAELLHQNCHNLFATPLVGSAIKRPTQYKKTIMFYCMYKSQQLTIYAYLVAKLRYTIEWIYVHVWKTITMWKYTHLTVCTYTQLNNSYMTLIGMHELHGWIHPN